MVRVSGPHAGEALEALAGKKPPPRHASYRTLRDQAGEELDRGLVLWFPGPDTATGEDLCEFHLHGGRAVVAAVLAALDQRTGLRSAEAGEFTRRAFENGRIDLAEAEGLADLLAAETDLQRRSALILAEGGLGRQIEAWQDVLLRCSALVEAELDFSDEEEVGQTSAARVAEDVAALAQSIETMLRASPAERLRDGVRVVLAGPVNAGKSSLFNALVDRDAAIVSQIAGTTRDRIEAPVVIDGVPLVLIDTAGLRACNDEIEALGIQRSQSAMADADIVLWLGDADEAPQDALVVAGKADIESKHRGIPVSTITGSGLPNLRNAIVQQAKLLLPRPGTLALNERHRVIMREVLSSLQTPEDQSDLLIVAENLRTARAGLNRITGRSGTDRMLDTLFSRFCVGK